MIIGEVAPRWLIPIEEWSWLYSELIENIKHKEVKFHNIVKYGHSGALQADFITPRNKVYRMHYYESTKNIHLWRYQVDNTEVLESADSERKIEMYL